MPRPKNYKCAACSRISDEEAKQRECWQGQLCHSRRSYYRHRQTRNSDRQLRYRLQKDKANQNDTPLIITVNPPLVSQPLAIITVYSPPMGGAHALAYEVWQNGKQIVLIEPVHTQGWTNLDLAAHTQNVLGELNKRFGITKFADRRSLSARECLIPGCPLHNQS